MFTAGILLAHRSEAKAKALIVSIASQVNLKDDYLYVALCCINESGEEQRRAELARDLGLRLKICKCFLYGR